MKIYHSALSFNEEPTETFVGDATTVYETMETIKLDYASRAQKIKAAWEKTFSIAWPCSLELKNCMINMVKRGNETLITTGSDVCMYIIRP